MQPEESPHASSVLGRLLQELSWSGQSIRDYRDGGLGFENVLTAEALQGLDFLPRSSFLGAVISAAHGAPTACAQLCADAELIEFTVLPPDVPLEAYGGSNQERISVYPDALLVSPGCSSVVEAKRIRGGSFRPEQLAREFLLAIRAAEGRTPLLLLILGAEPPVLVEGLGRVPIEDAIAAQIGAVLGRIGWSEYTREALLKMLPDVVTWITWHEISAVVEAQLDALGPIETSIRASITRLADSVTSAISRHS
jgi:hypothetical protein